KRDLDILRIEFRQDLNKQKLDILDAMDDKLAHLKGDMIVLMRKEDKKVQSLVELLHSKKVISEEEAKRILSMDLFPQVSLQ
ncbi:MAG: hypothetical protein Q8O19_07480, partial [Rectinemataceae bacterium]|nr:hypothetical protein [Rectinemataceae bacterium]